MWDVFGRQGTISDNELSEALTAQGIFGLSRTVADTGLADKPSFRSAFKRRRCLIPADGFYEWQARGRGPKQPFRVTLLEGLPFALAGLWEAWQEPGGDELASCAIITTKANQLLQEIHPRMPVILESADYDHWLDVDSTAPVQSLLRPAPDEWLMAYPVSTRVNNVRNDDAACVEPVSLNTA